MEYSCSVCSEMDILRLSCFGPTLPYQRCTDANILASVTIQIPSTSTAVPTTGTHGTSAEDWYQVLAAEVSAMYSMTSHRLKMDWNVWTITKKYINYAISDNPIKLCYVPSVLWRSWLGGRKGIRPVKNWAMGCGRGYRSAARCRLAYKPADATATHCLLLQ